MILTLDPKLSAPLGPTSVLELYFTEVLSKTIPPESEMTPKDKEVFLASSMLDTADLYHTNYLTYLAQAWGKHLPYVITPDIIWFTALCEIAQGIRANPERHRALFTYQIAKIEIALPVGHSEQILPLDLLMENLKKHVPVDIDLFLPEFSTTDQFSRLAQMAAFAETCTPYYSYMTFACGFPAVRIEGSDDDYERLQKHAHRLYDEFARIDAPLTSWLGNTLIPWIEAIVTARANRDAAFFSKIIRVTRCGSGSQIEVDGWWTNIYRKPSRYGRVKPENLPTHIARVPWVNIETGRRFTLNCGLFYSTQDTEGFLTPKFGWVQNEIMRVQNQDTNSKVSIGG